MPESDQEVPWSLYWAADRLHSCIALDQEQDQIKIDRVWQAATQELAAGANILDLATGNGAVLSAILAKRNDLNLYGVDRASIDPVKYLKERPSLSNVKFFADTDISTMPELGRKFELLTSQFGIEYAGLENTIDSLKGNLNLNGRIEFLIHHDSSHVIASSKTKLKELDTLLSENGLIEVLLEYVQGSVQFNHLESAGQAILDKPEQFSEAIAGQVFAAVETIVSARENLQVNSNPVDLAHSLALRLNAERQRLQQMANAARSEQEMSEYCRVLRQSGFRRIGCEPFYASDDYLLAWHLVATFGEG